MVFTSAKRAPSMAAFKRGNRKKITGARSGSKEGDQTQLPSSEPGIDAHGSQCVEGHYLGAASICQSCATLAEPAGYVVAIGSKLPGKIQHNGLTCRNKFLMDDAFLVEEGEQQFFLPWIFADNSFLVGGKSVNTTSSITVLIPDRTGRTKYHLQWYFPEAVAPGHRWKWSLHQFRFLFDCELVRHKSGADLPLTQIIADDGVRRVLVNIQFLRNLSVSHWSCVSICRTFSIISGVCLSMADRKVAHPQLFPSLRESIWTIRKHIFCSRLPSRTPAPTLHASPLQFSPIYSRTWCLHVVPLRCDTTSYTDYVQLAAVCLYNRSNAVHDVCRFSPCLKTHAHARIYAPSCHSDIGLTPLT